MMTRPASVFASLYLLCLTAPFTSSTVEPYGPKVVVLFISGFRWDYFERDPLLFTDVLQRGVHAESMRPSFPTRNYPNMYTLMTGLHPETHNVIGDFMYDEGKDQHFMPTLGREYNNPHWWDGGEPLWVTSEIQGRKTAMFNWIAADARIRYARPAHVKPHNDGQTLEDFHQSMEEGISLLRNDDVDFLGFYINDLQVAGLRFGPSSYDTELTLQKLSRSLTYFLNEMTSTMTSDGQRSLLSVTDVVIVSDHGMSSVVPLKLIDMTEYIPMDKVTRYLQDGPVTSIWPADDQFLEIYRGLKDAHPNMKVYHKSEFPERFRYRASRRVAPITAVVDPGWTVVDPNHHQPITDNVGDHGFDNEADDMQTIFAAFGPSFKVNHKVPAIDSVDVYQILCRLLRLRAAPHNGSWASVEDMFTPSAPSSSVNLALPMAVMSIVAVLLALVLLWLILKLCTSNRESMHRGPFKKSV